MTDSKTPPRKGFSIFRSAAEEARKKDQDENWEHEAGHMSCTSGRVIAVKGGNKPFKVVMSREGGEASEHFFATMREAEAFVRRNTPRPPERSRTYDRDSGST